MTVYDIVNTAWEDCGKFTPYQPTATDASDMLQILNRSLEAMVSWKGFQGRRKVFFPDYIGKVFVKNLTEDEVVSSYDGTNEVITCVTLPADFTLSDGDYVQFGDEFRLVYDVDTSSNEVWINEAFSDDPTTADDVTFYQKVLDPGVDRVKTYLRVENVSSQLELRRQISTLTDLQNLSTSGEPTAWRRNMGKIEFDLIPDDVYLWRVWYYRFPNLATQAQYVDATTEIDAPDDFHLAVMHYMESLLYRRMQEIDQGVASYQIFDNLMKTTIGSWEQENLLVGGGQIDVGIA